MASIPFITAWTYILLWPLAIVLTWFCSRRFGPRSSIDASLLASFLVAEFVIAIVGCLATVGTCALPTGTLLISNHVGNLVTTASFAVACLVAYITFSGPTLATWMTNEADLTLKFYGLKSGAEYLFRPVDKPAVASHAQQVFEACIDLAMTVEERRRARARPSFTHGLVPKITKPRIEKISGNPPART